MAEPIMPQHPRIVKSGMECGEVQARKSTTLATLKGG